MPRQPSIAPLFLAGVTALLCIAMLSGCVRGEHDTLPAKPLVARLRQIAAVPMLKAREVAFYKDTAFVAQNLEGMTTVDVEAPAHARLRKRFAPEFLQPVHLQQFGDDEMLVADRFRGLVVLDVSDVDSPTSLSQLALPGLLTHVQVFKRKSQTLAAVTCGGEGLAIVDLTDVRRPQHLAQFKTDIDFSRRVAVGQGSAFVADNFDGGLKVVGITIPASPQLQQKIQMRGFFDSVTLHNDILAVGARQYGTKMFRWSNMTECSQSPETTPVLTFLCTALRSKNRVRTVLMLDRDLMLIADDEGGVDLYDVNNPSLPVLADEFRYSSGGTAMSVEEHEGYVYIPSWDAGLVVMSIERNGQRN